MKDKIEHEGKTYILQTKAESIIQERIAKHATAKSAAESQLAEYEKQLKQYQKKAESAAEMETKITDLEGRLASTQKRFESYSSISSKGITNPKLVELVEWSHQNSGNGSSIGDWLQECIENPSAAPITIRPHIQELKGSRHLEQQSATVPAPAPTVAEPARREPLKPRSINSGAQPPPAGTTRIDELMKNYEQNRDEIHALVMKRA